MTGTDTNVLVRYITRDHPEQHAAAKRHLESDCTQQTPGYVNVIVLCELAWVLTTAYDASQEKLVRGHRSAAPDPPAADTAPGSGALGAR